VRERRYLFSDHSLYEADIDGLVEDDVLHILLTGDLDSTYADDLRGIRYVVRGFAYALEVDVVCRFDSNGILLIVITVYVVD